MYSIPHGNNKLVKWRRYEKRKTSLEKKGF